MPIEVPELKRACFCLPLRYSLLLWGYYRLITDIFDSFKKIRAMTVQQSFRKHIDISTFLVYFDATLTLVDIVLVIVYIIGAHKKSVQLLKTFYFYDLGVLIVLTLLNTALFIWVSVLLTTQYEQYSFIPPKVWLSASVEFIHLIIKAYVLLLLRSEIIMLRTTQMLRNNCQFRFVNNAAEEECTMTYIQTGDEELRSEDISNKEKFKCKYSCTETMIESGCNMKYKKLGDEELETGISSDVITNESENICLKGKLKNESEGNVTYKKLDDVRNEQQYYNRRT